MKNALLFAGLLIAVFGCKKDEILEVHKASIQVTVYNEDELPVENAQVALLSMDGDLIGEMASSDAQGVVSFTDIDTGYYALSATKPEVGNAIDMVFASEPITYKVSLYLIETNVNLLAPSVYRAEPSYSSVTVMPIDTVIMQLYVTDDNTPFSELNVTIESDLEGEMFSGHPDSENYVNVQLFPKTKGVHNITITAEDNTGQKTTEEFTINAVNVVPVELSATKLYKSVLLEWSLSIEQDFQKMEVQRLVSGESDYETLATIMNETTISFIDSTVDYVKNANYRIVTYDNEDRSAESNIYQVNYPAGMYFYYTYDHDIQDVLVHPDKNWVYLIIAETGEQKIIIYDYSKDEIVKEKNISYEPNYSILADNGAGLELFVPGDDGSINIYSTTEEISLIKTINTGDHGCTSLGVNGNGIIVAGFDLGYNDEYAVRTFNQASGVLIDSTSEYTEVRVIGVPNKHNVFIGIDYTVSIYNMQYLEIDDVGNFTSDIEDPYFTEYDFDYRYLSVAASGDYTICETDLFNTDGGLQHIASFSSTTIRGAITNNDGSIIYTHDFYVHDKITAYSYPSLDEIVTYDTREQPRFMNLKGEQIIVLTENSNKNIIEIIDLD